MKFGAERVQPSLKGENMLFFGGKTKRGGRKVGETNRNKRQTEGERMCMYLCGPCKEDEVGGNERKI